jgi:hypothetical protein
MEVRLYTILFAPFAYIGIDCSAAPVSVQVYFRHVCCNFANVVGHMQVGTVVKLIIG